jgi:hypothetical protein
MKLLDDLAQICALLKLDIHFASPHQWPLVAAQFSSLPPMSESKKTFEVSSSPVRLRTCFKFVPAVHQRRCSFTL